MNRLKENNYEEWLVTITNTRLIFNTMDEYEEKLGCKFHGNGIKRYYKTPQEMRACFRDFKVEVAEATDGVLVLEDILTNYKRSWEFYHNNLTRRNNPTQIALEILDYCIHSYSTYKYGKKKQTIYNQILTKQIDPTFLVLFLLKAIPGYDSTAGDVVDFNRKYEEVIALLETFTSEGTMFASLPVISMARDEKWKSRIMLIYHVTIILNHYATFISSCELMSAVSDVKEDIVPLEMAGYWNECGGLLDSTQFWEFEPTAQEGIFWPVFYQKKADNKLFKTKYTMCTMKCCFNKLLLYLAHPKSIVHRIKGLKYKDADHTWYECDFPPSLHPDTLPLQRRLFSSVWQQHLNLTRVTNESVIQQYEKWKRTCEVVNNYPECDYEFSICLYAVTQEALFIKANNDSFYKIPKDINEGFSNINLNDNVGIITINGKDYIAFDELSVYISTSENQLKKYGITLVDYIL